MGSWRDSVLEGFVPNVSRLTLVADPDCLLTEERMALELRSRGFELIEFSDPVEFRYAYETKYRSIWDRGEHTDLVVILRLEHAELDALPYDLLQVGRKLSFSLGELFPELSYPVIDKLDRSLLDGLFEAQIRVSPDRMGDNATMDFIIRNVFEIDAGLIADDVALLRMLLRMHYGHIQMPGILVERLMQVLARQDCFSKWPLNEIVPDGDAFFAFLQERWPIFLSGLGGAHEVQQGGSSEDELKYSGPYRLPFQHSDIKVYIDNLFLEGKLVPVEANNIEVAADSWVGVGMATTGVDNQEPRIGRLFDRVEEELPRAEYSYIDWIAFALKWAELSSLVHCGGSVEYKNRLAKVGDSINSIFAGWLTEHYSSIMTLPAPKCAMLHHVPRCLARDMEESGGGRVALVLVDGLALDQWVTVRHFMQKHDANLVIRESATFAWIPTLTSVSRQALFSGKLPLYFPSSINSTNREEKLWKQFWEEHGVPKSDIAYQRGLGDASSVIASEFHLDKTTVVGLVVDKVDKIMHGMQLGSAGMHNQIKQWCGAGFLSSLVGQLLDYGYKVWLTADHGNIECDGKGRPSEGVIAETRGERVRVYPTPELRSQVSKSFEFAYEWEPVGLPSDYYPLVAGGRDAFVRPGESIVGHGGISMEEVIVPLVKFARKA